MYEREDFQIIYTCDKNIMQTKTPAVIVGVFLFAIYLIKKY